jgi:PBSX family phage terminase large subunit
MQNFMQLHESQKQVASSKARFRVCCNGRRWGKTTLAVEEIKGKALAAPSRICYIAPTIQQARDIAWEMLKKELHPITVKSRESPSLEMEVLTKDLGKSTIYLRGWENIETLRGQYFDFLVIDEVASMKHFWSNWQEVIRPTLTDTQGEVLFISTPKGYNHFYDLFNFELKDNNYKSFHFTSYDNPYIVKEEIDQAKKEVSPERFSQEYLADFTKTEGLIYKDFSRKAHVVDTDPDDNYINEYIAGVDWGFEHPAVVLHIKVDRSGTIWIVDEWVRTHKIEDEIAEYVASCQFHLVYPDPENASGVENLTRMGVSVREVKKGKGSVADGIDRVRQYLRMNKLKVHQRCTSTIEEFETYSYQDGKEEPVKENDDCMDALRYALVSNELGGGIMNERQHDKFVQTKFRQSLNSSK